MNQPTLSQQKMLKIQFFAKFIRDCELLLETNPTSEAGIVRMKLQEATYWATVAITKEPETPPMAAPMMPPMGTPMAPPANDAVQLDSAQIPLPDEQNKVEPAAQSEPAPLQ